MPETLKGLWKQRLRWAQGGAEVFLVNLRKMARWEHHRMWPLFLEYALSTLWAFCLWGNRGVVHSQPYYPSSREPGRCEPVSPGVYRAAAGCDVPAAIPREFDIERRYERKVAGSLFWVIWFPMVYWMIGLFTTLWHFRKSCLNVNAPARAGSVRTVVKGAFNEREYVNFD
jgi:biofilm PGA synthesis N-glycosyltransferase PgaC